CPGSGRGPRNASHRVASSVPSVDFWSLWALRLRHPNPAEKPPAAVRANVLDPPRALWSSVVPAPTQPEVTIGYPISSDQHVMRKMESRWGAWPALRRVG